MKLHGALSGSVDDQTRLAQWAKNEDILWIDVKQDPGLAATADRLAKNQGLEFVKHVGDRKYYKVDPDIRFCLQYEKPTE